MQAFTIYIENTIQIFELKDTLKHLFPMLNFYNWEIQNNIIDGERDKQLDEKDILLEIVYITGNFKTCATFYRFPGDETNSRVDLFIGRTLSKLFKCKVAIDGYSYCEFDQMPDYRLIIENDKAHLIPDDYPQEDSIIQEIDISIFMERYDEFGQLQAS